MSRAALRLYLVLEHGQPVDVVEPAVLLDVLHSVDEVPVPTCQVLLDHVVQQVAQVAGQLELPHSTKYQTSTTSGTVSYTHLTLPTNREV